MIEVDEHMQLLLQQAHVKNEQPLDGSFLPLSLMIACLIRQLPQGLAPPAGLLSFHQIDHLPMDFLVDKMEKSIMENPQKCCELVKSLVLYTKVTRSLLGICHDHLCNKKYAEEALGQIVEVILHALRVHPEVPEEQEEDEKELEEEKEEEESGDEKIIMPLAIRRRLKPHRSRRPKRSAIPPLPLTPISTNTALVEPLPATASIAPPSMTLAKAVDPAGIMKRAIGRDLGDGSAVLDIMRKYPTDFRIQTHGVRALKGIVRQYKQQQVQAQLDQTMTTTFNKKPIDPQDSDSDIDSESGSIRAAPTTIAWQIETPQDRKVRESIQYVIQNMNKYPHATPLQIDGLFCLSEYTSMNDRHVAVVTSCGGITTIMDALARLPDEEDAQIAGLCVLGNPKIAEDSIVRVNPESRRLVLSAMKRFPLHEKIQGLSCLALANLSQRQDESMYEIVSKGGLEMVVEAMKRFTTNAPLQAAGCWLFGVISNKSNEMQTAVLDAGGLPVCEKARVRFEKDPKVQKNAEYAIQKMLAEEKQKSTQQQQSTECCIQ